MFEKKLITSILVSAVVALAGLTAFFKGPTIEAKASSSTLSEGVSLFDGDQIPVNSTLLESDTLEAKIVHNSITPDSQFYNIRFSTARYGYSSIKYSSVKLVVEDEDFEDPGVAVEEEQRKTFNAYVYSIKGQKTYSDVVIPEMINYIDHFNLKVIGIHKHAIKAGEYKNITSIIIPEDCEYVEDESFEEIPEDVEIKYCGESIPETWAESWYTIPEGGADPTITLNYELTEAEHKRNDCPKYETKSEISNGGKFLLGYYDNTIPERYKPLYLCYDVYKGKSETPEHRVSQFTLKSTAVNKYEAVGQPVGQESNTLSIVISLGKDEVIDDENLVVDGLTIPYKHPTDGYIPNLELGTYKVNVSPNTGKLNLNQFVETKPVKFSNYGGFTQVDINMDTVPGIYELLKPDIYYEFEEKINSGICYVRYRLTGLGDASYLIKYKVNNEVKSKTIKINSPYDHYNLPYKSGNVVGFIFEDRLIGDDFVYSNLVSFGLANFMFTVDLYSNETNDIVNSKANSTTPFGFVTLYNAEDGVISSANLLNVLIIVIVAAVVIYIIAAVSLFFYFKRRFRNDEFRRLKPKQFVKKGILYFVGYAFIVMAITYIVFRWGMMNTSIVAFNPLDVFVIIFTIGAAIAIGLFIRDLVVAIRANKKRKETIRLKLDQDVVDDGTK